MMETTIIYNKYSHNDPFLLLGERRYSPKDKADYDRVMRVFEENPDEYELVNVEYGFKWVEKKY